MQKNKRNAYDYLGQRIRIVVVYSVLHIEWTLYFCFLQWIGATSATAFIYSPGKVRHRL